MTVCHPRNPQVQEEQKLQDWGDMLLRMYTRFLEMPTDLKLKSWTIRLEIGGWNQSVTLSFEGPHAYGLLKSEMGVHRLVPDLSI